MIVYGIFYRDELEGVELSESKAHQVAIQLSPSPQVVNRYVEPLTVIRGIITPEMIDAIGRRIVEQVKATRHEEMLERGRALSVAAMERT